MLADLQAGLSQLGIDSQPEQQQACLLLLEQLVKWNRVHNLTAVRDPQAMLSRHIIESLSLYSIMQSMHRLRLVLDVGTGAGFPGLPLAIFFPSVQFTLLDSCDKKLSFIRHIIMQLELANVSIVHQRIEAYRPACAFDLVIARAFTTCQRLSEWAAPCLGADGVILAMKGPLAPQEAAAVTDYEVACMPNSVPGSHIEQYIVRIAKRGISQFH